LCGLYHNEYSEIERKGNIVVHDILAYYILTWTAGEVVNQSDDINSIFSGNCRIFTGSSVPTTSDVNVKCPNSWTCPHRRLINVDKSKHENAQWGFTRVGWPSLNNSTTTSHFLKILILFIHLYTEIVQLNIIFLFVVYVLVKWF